MREADIPEDRLNLIMIITPLFGPPSPRMGVTYHSLFNRRFKT